MQREYSIPDVTDGTSNTVDYAEAIVGVTNFSGPVRGNGTGPGGTALASGQLDAGAKGLAAVPTDLAATAGARA
jgi:hypothetical protein